MWRRNMREIVLTDRADGIQTDFVLCEVESEKRMYSDESVCIFFTYTLFIREEKKLCHHCHHTSQVMSCAISARSVIASHGQ